MEAYAEKYDLTKGQVLKKGLELLYRQDQEKTAEGMCCELVRVRVKTVAILILIQI